jgi:hypothetical protein
MKTGAKIALGCGIAFVAVGVIGVVGMVAATYWAKQKVVGKLEQLQGDQKQIDTFLKQARSNPFTPPTDGVITESQLVKFLDVRKRVFPIYSKYGQQLEELDKHKSQGPGFRGVTTLMNAFNELRLAQAQAMAEVGLSPNEYVYLVGAVYKTYYAAALSKSSGGKTWSQVAGEASKALDASRPSPGEGDAASEATEEAQRQLRDAARQMQDAAKSLDVPPANLALFQKYDAEIQKYVMPGLEVAELGFLASAQ